MNKAGSFILVMLLLCVSTWAYAKNNEFSGREKYSDVSVIELKDLFERRNKVVIVDARSKYEYKTLRIKGARNIPINSKTFVEELKKLRIKTSKPIVFYCNGHTCFKSYKATRKAQLYGIENCFAYDAGVFDWARAYPKHTVLLGKSPIKVKDLISKKKFKIRLLKPSKFVKMVGPSSIILDVRDSFQREAVGFFPGLERRVDLDNTAKLKKYIKRAKKQNKTLLIYDAVGKQVRWLQYTLEAAGLRKYYFMKKGAKGYYDMIMKEQFGDRISRLQ